MLLVSPTELPHWDKYSFFALIPIKPTKLNKKQPTTYISDQFIEIWSLCMYFHVTTVEEPDSHKSCLYNAIL